jgi:hypothetical protein
MKRGSSNIFGALKKGSFDKSDYMYVNRFFWQFSYTKNIVEIFEFTRGD